MKDLYPLIPYLKKYKVKLLIGFIFVIVSIFLQSLYPLTLGNAIDAITNNSEKTPFYFYSLLSVAIILVGGIFLFFTRQSLFGI